MMEINVSDYIIAKYKRELLGRLADVKQEQKEFYEANKYDSSKLENRESDLIEALTILNVVEAEAILGELEAEV